MPLFPSKRTNKHIPTETICDLIRIILTMNNFTFNSKHYLQKHGTAMGTKMAPSYANLFLGKFEHDALLNSPYQPHIWLRFNAWFNFTCHHPPPGNPGDKSSPSVPGVGNCLKRSCPGGRGVGQIENNFLLFLGSTSLLG